MPTSLLQQRRYSKVSTFRVIHFFEWLKKWKGIVISKKNYKKTYDFYENPLLYKCSKKSTIFPTTLYCWCRWVYMNNSNNLQETSSGFLTCKLNDLSNRCGQMFVGTKCSEWKDRESTKEISAIWAPHFSICLWKGVKFLPTLVSHSLAHSNNQ